MDNIYTLYVDNNRRSDDNLTVNSCGITDQDGFGGYGEVSRPKGREDYQLLIVVKGVITYIVNGEEQILTAGTAILQAPHVPQRFYPEKGTPYETRWVHFTGRSCPALLADLGLPLHRVFPLDDVTEFLRLTGEMAYEHSHQKPYYSMRLTGQMLALLALIARQVHYPASVGRGTWETRLDEARKEIFWQHRYQVDFEKIAAKCGLSYSRFQHLFTRQFGISPQHYQIAMRMETARNLLQSTSLSIRQVAEKCGYSDQNYFSRVFKKYCGYSPSHFRK